MPHKITGYSIAEVLPNNPKYQHDTRISNKILQKQSATKTTMKINADQKAYVKPSELQVGDWVKYFQEQRKKCDTPYCGIPHQISNIDDSKVTAVHEGYTTTWHTTSFKNISQHIFQESATTIKNKFIIF